MRDAADALAKLLWSWGPGHPEIQAPPPTPTRFTIPPEFLDSLVAPDEISELSDRLQGNLSISQGPAEKTDPGPARPGEEEAAPETASTSSVSADETSPPEDDVMEPGIEEAVRVLEDFHVTDREVDLGTSAKMMDLVCTIQDGQDEIMNLIIDCMKASQTRLNTLRSEQLHAQLVKQGIFRPRDYDGAVSTPRDHPELDESRRQPNRSLPAQRPSSPSGPRTRAKYLWKDDNWASGRTAGRITKGNRMPAARTYREEKRIWRARYYSESAFLDAMDKGPNHRRPRVGSLESDDDFEVEGMELDG